MPVETLIEENRWQNVDLPALAKSATDMVLTHLQIDPARAEINILACDDARITSLNAQFRDQPKATNVLSWPSADLAAPAAGEIPPLPELGSAPELGDIALAYETCVREAQQAGKPLADHVIHLLVHGTLHLLGYDHENDADAELMEKTEVNILGKLGIADPY